MFIKKKKDITRHFQYTLYCTFKYCLYKRETLLFHDKQPNVLVSNPGRNHTHKYDEIIQVCLRYSCLSKYLEQCYLRHDKLGARREEKQRQKMPFLAKTLSVQSIKYCSIQSHTRETLFTWMKTKHEQIKGSIAQELLAIKKRR